MSGRKWVHTITLEEYQEKFADYFVIGRTDGVVTVRMHRNGGPARYSKQFHGAVPELLHDIGNDPHNELLILTGTGSSWIDGMDDGAVDDYPLWSMTNEDFYQVGVRDATGIIENALWGLDIPTIAAVNGPGSHTEFALLCDLTLCTGDTVFFDPHANMGFVAGDGLHIILQELLGLKRANYYLYTGEGIDAAHALEWGLVNEVVPEGDLLSRAEGIAGQIMKMPRNARRLQSHIVKRPWKRRMLDELHVGLVSEMLAVRMDEPSADAMRDEMDGQSRR